MAGRAVVIGIDDYKEHNSLEGCVRDAVGVATRLEKHGNGGDPNFEVLLVTSDKDDVSADELLAKIKRLFSKSSPSETAILYFAGHGIIDDETSKGFLQTPDGTTSSPGVNLDDVIELANKAYPEIQSSIIVLDCCHSGVIASGSAYKGISKNVSAIGDGVTIMTACRQGEVATEDKGQGTFTSILLDGLDGAASDVLGRITPASLYAYVDQSLGEFEQRPVYKANVQKFVTVRTVPPKVSKEILRKLPEYFPFASHVFKLDPSYEKDRGEEAKNLEDIPYCEKKHKIYRELQKLCNQGLIKPTEHDHMWHSAVFSGGCKLTATGAHYRYLAERGKI